MADNSKPTKPTLGATYSPIYARYLGLDVKKSYVNILKDLKVRSLRIPTYWSEYEKEEGNIDLSEVDFMVSEAAKNNASIILVVGMKQPRWPECHIPDWAKELTVKQRQEKLLKYTETVVKRYKKEQAIISWQVENEPLFGFGEMCDKPNLEFLKREIALVKSLDNKRPIVVTETGEWSFWIKAAKVSDILGVSVYRKAYNSVLGHFDYPFPAAIYHIKSNLVRRFLAPKNQKTIISELQTEPWLKMGVTETPIEGQLKAFGISDFENTIKYAQKTSFDDIYLWGVEWWIWMAQQGHPEYLNYARELFAK